MEGIWVISTPLRDVLPKFDSAGCYMAESAVINSIGLDDVWFTIARSDFRSEHIFWFVLGSFIICLLSARSCV